MAIGGCIAFYFALRVNSFYSSSGEEGLPTTGLLMIATLQVALVALGIASIIGGGAAIQRKSYSMAVIGGVCSTLCSTIFGLVGLILVIRSRVEFADQKDEVKVRSTPRK